MDINVKHESQQIIDKYLFNKRKINHISNQSYLKNKNIFDSFKVSNNKSYNHLIKINEKQNKSYNKSKNNIIGFHVPEYELISLKRDEAKHLFSNEYIKKNKKRILNKNYNLIQKNNSFKFRNNFNFPQNDINSNTIYLNKYFLNFNDFNVK